MFQMRLTYALLSGIIALFPLACAPVAVDLDAERTSLAEAVEAYNASMSALHPEAAAALYADEVIVIPNEKAVFKTKQAAEDYLAATAGNPGFQVSFETFIVEVASSGDSGYSVARVTVQIDGPDGEPIQYVTRDVHFWEKNALGEWRIVLDTWNAAPVASAPAEAD